MVTPQQASGTFGEALARYYLEGVGLAFVAANWSCRLGEIDLIMRDGSTLVFVEVRLRAPTDFGEGLETVARDKQRRLIRAARFYLQAVDWSGDARFDVVSIEAGAAGQEPIVEHIPYAFDEY